MLHKTVLFAGLLGTAVLPSYSAADGAELEVDWAPIRSSGHRDVQIQVTIKNISAGEVEVQHPRNRCAIAFVVMDQHGNVVRPVGVAKVDPLKASIKLKPGESYVHRLEQRSQLARSQELALPFLTGTGLFAYDLKDGTGYRVTLIYRPHGLQHDGIASSERVYGGEDR